MSLSVEQIHSYFNFLCTNVYKKTNISFYELNLTSVKCRSITYDQNNQPVYGDNHEFTWFIENQIEKINPDQREEILQKWEVEIPKAKLNEIIDLGIVEAYSNGDGSFCKIECVAVKAQVEPEEIILVVHAQNETEPESESDEDLAMYREDRNSVKNLLSMVVMPKFMELVKVYYDGWGVSKMSVAANGLHERPQDFDWEEYKARYFPFVRKEDCDRYYCYTSQEFLSRAQPGEIYKFFYRSKRLSSNGKYYWYSSTIKVKEDYFSMYTIDVSDEFNKMHLIESRNTRYQDRYKSAIVSDAIAFYEFNLTKNKIIGRPLQSIGEKRIPILDSIGLSKKCSYTDFIEANSWTLGEEERKIYKEKMDPAFLFANYKRGEYEIWYDLARKNYDGQTFWTRTTVILMKDEYTKDINGLAVVKNITDIHAAEEEKVYQMEVINGLSIDYSNIFLCTRDFSSLKAVRISDSIKGFYEDLIMGLNYSDALEVYIETSVYEGDRDMMKIAFSKRNVVKQLKMHESFSVNYRSFINNKLAYYKLQVVRIGSPEEYSDILFGFVNVDAEIEHEMEQKKLLEEALTLAESANRAKTKFLSSMSHDIRTPMNAIIGFTTLAEEHITDAEEVKEYLKKIKSNSSHLLSLINDILDMSRIESGRLKIRPVACSLDEIIESLNDVILPLVTQKNIKFTVKEINVQNRHFFCDELRLNQILMNIIGNSVKFTKSKGEISLTITQIASSDDSLCSFQFKIVDNGIGMSEELQKHLYEPFTREDNPSVEKIQGSGLGMSITKNIVDLMHGCIYVNSKLGIGTEALICLDFKIIDKSEYQKTRIARDEVVDVREFTGKRILLTEDNAFNREIAITLLRDQGFEVEWAENGEVAVNKISDAEAGYYDLVLMDVMMPVMNGLDATRAIRKLEDSEKANIPIVAMTANAFDEDRRNTQTAGMDDYISKPFNMKDLLKILKKFLL